MMKHKAGASSPFLRPRAFSAQSLAEQSWVNVHKHKFAELAKLLLPHTAQSPALGHHPSPALLAAAPGRATGMGEAAGSMRCSAVLQPPELLSWWPG